MDLPLSDEEREALAAFLNEAIADDLFPLSLRLRPLKSVLVKLDAPQQGQTSSDGISSRP
jgi:hypothetical protein